MEFSCLTIRASLSSFEYLNVYRTYLLAFIARIRNGTISFSMLNNSRLTLVIKGRLARQKIRQTTKLNAILRLLECLRAENSSVKADKKHSIIASWNKHISDPVGIKGLKLCLNSIFQSSQTIDPSPSDTIVRWNRQLHNWGTGKTSRISG